MQLQYVWLHVVTESSSYTMSGLVVAYMRLKTKENYKALSTKSGCGHLGRVIVNKIFYSKDFNWQKFWCFALVVAYKWWSHIEVQRTVLATCSPEGG